MNTKFLVTLGVIAVVLAAAGFVATGSKNKKLDVDKEVATVRKENFFPGLEEKLNDIAKIEVSDAKNKLTLVRKEETWTLEESAGYEAKLEPVRNLLMDLGNIKKLEAKTSSPDLYKRIDVDDMKADGSNAKLVKLYDESGAEKASLIVGKDDYSSGDPGKGPNKYVRKPEDKQAWLVAGNVRLVVNQPSWLKSDFMDIAATRVKSTEILHKDGERVLAERADKNAVNFELKTLPAGREVKDASSPSEAGRILASVRFDEVKKREDLKLSDENTSATVRVETFDGLIVKAAIHHVDNKDYVVTSASVDEARITAENDAKKADYELKKKAAEMASESAATKAEDAKDGEKKEGDAAATPEATPAPITVPEPDIVDLDKIKKEAEDINKKLGDWAYVVPNYYRDRFTRKNEFFLKELKKEGEENAAEAPQMQGLPEGMSLPPGMSLEGIPGMSGK